MKKLTHFLAFGFGSGLLKPAPGTWGSLVGLIFSYICWLIMPPVIFGLMTLAMFLAGGSICGKTSKDLNVHDDGRIVWDEIVAIFFIVLFLPEYSLLYYLLTFVLFRFFDILKPFPIRYFDAKLETGFGIMFDDILAAIYSIIIIYLIYFLI